MYLKFFSNDLERIVRKVFNVDMREYIRDLEFGFMITQERILFLVFNCFYTVSNLILKY